MINTLFGLWPDFSKFVWWIESRSERWVKNKQHTDSGSVSELSAVDTVYMCRRGNAHTVIANARKANSRFRHAHAETYSYVKCVSKWIYIYIFHSICGNKYLNIPHANVLNWLQKCRTRRRIHIMCVETNRRIFVINWCEQQTTHDLPHSVTFRTNRVICNIHL